MKTPAARKPITRRRRLLFFSVLLTIVWITIEGIAALALSFTDRDFTVAELRERQSQAANGAGVSEGAGETIHPYLGWIHNPQVATVERYEGKEIPVNALGFRDSSAGVLKRSDDVFIVGIAGGSVAFQLSWAAEELLKERLSVHPKIKGRRVEIVRLALSGYKQPQQLMAYSYLLSLGAEFDLIINIDGFNETSLAILENAYQKTFIAYPRSWHARTIAITDPRVSADAATLLFLRGKRQQMAQSILASPLRWSPVCNFVWHVRDEWATGQLTELGIQVSANRRQSFLHHGPENIHTDTALDDDVASLWQRCSLQMHYLALGNNTQYLHILQPNQYVPDSKPMGTEERKVCYVENSETLGVIQRLFPILRQKGRELEERGVRFSDQTMVFAGTEQALYVDPWCHFNLEGNRIFAEAICLEVNQLLNEGKK